MNTSIEQTPTLGGCKPSTEGTGGAPQDDLLEEQQIIDQGDAFFAPVRFDLIDSLLSEYSSLHTNVLAVSEFIGGRMAASVMHYFVDGNFPEDRSRHGLTVAGLFDLEGALAALRAAYWSKALHLTDVLHLMPHKRREAWFAQMRVPAGKRKDVHAVRNERRLWPERFDEEGEYLDPHEAFEHLPLPEFNEETVRSTLLNLLSLRAQFLGERVDGIFRGLSGEHVTNAPEAFGKRMIMANVLDSCGTCNESKTGLITDLRAVLAKLMGRDEPKFHPSNWQLTRHLMNHWGEWVTIDGGAIRIRLYKKGTAHIEVHPDMSWRLNQILASLHPTAIPAQFRQRPVRKARAVELIRRPLPFAVVEALAELRQARVRRQPDWPERWDLVPNAVALCAHTLGKNLLDEVRSVLKAIGGVPSSNGLFFEFDYPPFEVIQEVAISGCMPDAKSHQYHPTQERLARMAVELAEIGDLDECCEPSAGTGGLADYMPKQRTTCVEVSPLHCKVLQAKGFSTVCADFIDWASSPLRLGSFARVVMNPPFDRGRWLVHLEHAARLVRAGGRLVAILPSSARGTALPGFTTSWTGPFADEFPGADVRVVVLVADRQPT